jgi:uncharacterized protein YcaQ
MVTRDIFSPAEARRVALAAQGFAESRPDQAQSQHLKRLTRRLGLLQIDSVNVLVRAHYMPAFSRLGGYGVDLLDKAAYDGRRRHLFEYWGHEASLLPVEYYPLFRWRMDEAEKLRNIWGGVARAKREQADYVERIFEEVRARGPVSAGDLEMAGGGKGAWWGWSDGKRALEYLFWSGRVTTAARRNFERVYDLTERVLPKPALSAPVPDKAEAQRRLLMIAARSLGIATEPDLRDYFRLKPEDSKPRLAELVEAGALLPVTVKGWSYPAYLHPESRLPRRVRARALLSPFDPLIWARARTLRMWNFHYRIEIYTPEAKRRHGYYVLPFLLGEDLVGRVDLKADRATGTLRAQASHSEPGVDVEMVAAELLVELQHMAAWLGLERVVVAPRGDLAETLHRHHAAVAPAAAG